MNTTWPRYRGCEGEQLQYTCTAANCTAANCTAVPPSYYQHNCQVLEEEIIGRDGRVVSGFHVEILIL